MTNKKGSSLLYVTILPLSLRCDDHSYLRGAPTVQMTFRINQLPVPLIGRILIQPIPPAFVSAYEPQVGMYQFLNAASRFIRDGSAIQNVPGPGDDRFIWLDSQHAPQLSVTRWTRKPVVPV